MSAPVPLEKTDAGLREQDHYRSRLAWWRYTPRQWLLPLIRYETPYLAILQQTLRSSSFDAYFSITANLGTHTFFMVFLPILAFCGRPDLLRVMVHILAAGVFYTGVLKDFLCLPRPLSPPLVRITMSHGAALEYGFPSTHSCNALSVAVYVLISLNDPATDIDPTLKLLLEVVAGTYAFSIVLGRLYCGMHGFLDILIGSAMGSAISFLQYYYVTAFDRWFLAQGPLGLVLVIGLIVAGILLHPEPADDCPCFDDSVAFAGVVLGIELANWLHLHRFGGLDPIAIASSYDYASVGLLFSVLRIVLGIAVIIAWRSIAKVVLLRGLPPLFRIFGRAGFLLPRRFFKQAPDYENVPSGLQMDTLIPPISKLPAFVRSIAYPRKSRSVSIGPQSAADAYEAIAYRQKVRRESQDRLASPGIGPRSRTGQTLEMSDYFTQKVGRSTAIQKPEMPPTPAAMHIAAPNGVLDANPSLLTPLTPAGSAMGAINLSRSSSADRREREEERAVFASLPKPRTRFDIEIVTKLVVYSGISFLATAGLPMFFDFVGLA